MHVAVEATRLERELRGIGRYVRALLPRMAALRPDLRYTLFVKRSCDASKLAATLERDGVPGGVSDITPVSRMGRTRADVCWFPWNVVRPAPPPGPVVVTIHDVVPIALPDERWIAWRKRRRWRSLFSNTALRATLVLADSAFTAGEVNRMLGVPPERIRVAPLGADHFVLPPSLDEGGVLARLGIPQPFFLTVGSGEPRKNLALVYGAMGRLIGSGAAVALVQAGPPHNGQRGATTNASWLREVGYVQDADLAVLYRHAAALVFPSKYEGFGLPVLEAMRSGTPVVCTRATSLPEVAGDAALYVGVDDDTGLATALARILYDEPFRARLSDAGRARAGEFRWEDTARATLAALDEARRSA
jgi:glycosyltransferase involved in cell wall biosynthesis